MQIYEIGDGIIRWAFHNGTGHDVQVFDIPGGRTSAVMMLDTPDFTSYFDADTGECFLAYYKPPLGDMMTLRICDVFNEQGFSTEIEVGKPPLVHSEMNFVSKNEIDIEYQVEHCDMVKKTVTFR